MVAEIICVGTELLLGDILNTNAQFLSRRLADLGVSVFYQTVVGDNEARLLEAIRLAGSRSDLMIFSGGLGPTTDDITKETVAKALGLENIADEEQMQKLSLFFSKRNLNMTQNNLKQALIPEGATVLENDNGTAPGVWIEQDGKFYAILPGPPNELIPMFETTLVPLIKQQVNGKLVSKTLKLIGIGESAAAHEIQDLIDSQSNPSIAPYAKLSEVHFRITAKADSEAQGRLLIESMESAVRERLGQYIYTDEGLDLEDVLVQKMTDKGMTIATAESCTGGLVAAALINPSGASRVFIEGVIAYGNEVKVRDLGVRPTTLEISGAVSAQTAKEMAVGMRQKAGTDIGLSVTGIAGPLGGTADKPVGLVWLGLAIGDKVLTRELHLSGSRMKIRTNAAKQALVFLYQTLLQE